MAPKIQAVFKLWTFYVAVGVLSPLGLCDNSWPKISSRLAISVCTQRAKFFASSQLQIPAKSGSSYSNGGIPCVWLELRSGKFHQSCDQMANRQSPRIIGGVEAKPGDFPMIVSVRYGEGWNETEPGRHHQCTGFIINELWAMTADHCFVDKPIDTVVAGEADSRIEEGTEQIRRIVKRIPPPTRYNQTYEQDHDINLLKLDSPFVFNEFVAPAILPPPSFEPQGIVKIAGWGKTTTNITERSSPPPPKSPTVSPVLYTSDIPVIPRAECQEQFQKFRPNFTLAPNLVCVGWDDGHAGPCFGDSGGPLVGMVDGRATVLGVTHAISSDYCAEAGHPARYIKISLPYYYEYIEKTIKENS